MLLSQRREMPQLHVDKRHEHARITPVSYFCTMYLDVTLIVEL